MGLKPNLNLLLQEDEEADREIAQVTDGADAQSVQSAGSESISHALIHPNDCLRSLRAFVEDTRNTA